MSISSNVFDSSDCLYQVYGQELCRFEESVVHRQHLLVPCVVEGQAGRRVVVIDPAGEKLGFSRTVYGSSEEAIAAGRQEVDEWLKEFDLES